MSRTGLFIPPVGDGPRIDAGITYVDNHTRKWLATAQGAVFSDGPYVACVESATRAAAYFRQTDGAGFGAPTASGLRRRA